MFSDLGRPANCVGTAFWYRQLVVTGSCGIMPPTLGYLHRFCSEVEDFKLADFVVAVANIGHDEPEFLQVHHMIAVAWSNPGLYVHRVDEGMEVEYEIPFDRAMRHHNDLTTYQHIGLAVVRSELPKFVEYNPRRAR